jgi:hypothetical protein
MAGNDYRLGDPARRNGRAARFRQVIAIRPGKALDYAEIAQASQVPRQAVWREGSERRDQVGAAGPAILTFGPATLKRLLAADIGNVLRFVHKYIYAFFTEGIQTR